MEWKNEYALDGFTTPIREEVLQRRDGTVMTRNSYGAHCLNTERVAIADIDLPEPPSAVRFPVVTLLLLASVAIWLARRSEEHTSELQSPDHLVCRLLLEKKKQTESPLS